MKTSVSEIEIHPIKPRDGVVAYTSFVIANSFYVSGVAIVTRLEGGYRLTYPTRVTPERSFNICYPISKEAGQAIESAVIEKYTLLLGKHREL